MHESLGLGTGLQDRDFITTDYHLFVQDDLKVSSGLTVNLGLRYELDPPPYDTKGCIGGFDPELYLPPAAVDSNGFPVGPPARGIIEAGNALPQYSLPGVLRVGKRVIKSIDPNNFGPRIGLAWSPREPSRFVVRAGYGIFFARPSFFYVRLAGGEGMAIPRPSSVCLLTITLALGSKFLTCGLHLCLTSTTN